MTVLAILAPLFVACMLPIVFAGLFVVFASAVAVASVAAVVMIVGGLLAVLASAVDPK